MMVIDPPYLLLVMLERVGSVCIMELESLTVWRLKDEAVGCSRCGVFRLTTASGGT
jgi:hypothetical protein